MNVLCGLTRALSRMAICSAGGGKQSENEGPCWRSHMEMKNLGRTGVKVSDLCLGCMMFGGKTEPNDSYAIIDR